MIIGDIDTCIGHIHQHGKSTIKYTLCAWYKCAVNNPGVKSTMFPNIYSYVSSLRVEWQPVSPAQLSAVWLLVTTPPWSGCLAAGWLFARRTTVWPPPLCLYIFNINSYCHSCNSFHLKHDDCSKQHRIPCNNDVTRYFETGVYIYHHFSSHNR